jgi:hypothetical protein
MLPVEVDAILSSFRDTERATKVPTIPGLTSVMSFAHFHFSVFYFLL